MKTYVKTIEAVQFTGDIQAIADFAGEGNKVLSEDGKVTLVTETNTWNVSKGDYIVKEYNGVVVFKEPRFLKDYKVGEDKFTPKVHSVVTPSDTPKSQGTKKEDFQYNKDAFQGNKDIASAAPINKTNKPEEK